PFTDSVTKEMLVGSIGLDIGFSIARKVNQLKEDINSDFNTIVACGGGMNSVVIPRVVSTLTGIPIKIYENFQEPSLMGCFEAINSAFKKSKKDKNQKIRFEYHPENNDALNESYKIWENINFNTI
ncbi:hypothetical protein EQ500_01860, partial [Lactobacillus sp. XV13L]|nr:hypothetical protein [Lactobacillus sp. XV13L]